MQGKGRPKSKRPRLSPSDDDASTPRDTPPSKIPARTLLKRSADDSNEYEITPRPGRKQNAKSRVRSTPHVEEEKEAKQLDVDIDDLLDVSSITFDSIMDSDSEDEDEVNDLLAKT
jgi:condensin complex subunit 3